MSPIEIVGVLVSALAIALTAKRKMACWPVGLASVALYGWIFYDAKLYSDMLLQGAFAIMQVYGWWRWIAAPSSSGAGSAQAALTSVRVVSASWRRLLPGLVAGAVGSVALGGLMAHFTDAALPWVDATLSSFSLVAQYWTARKYIASWGLWTIVDCVYVGMFVFKDLYPTAALYAFFVFLAVTGWRDWRKTLRLQDAAPTASASAASLSAPGPLGVLNVVSGDAPRRVTAERIDESRSRDGGNGREGRGINAAPLANQGAQGAQGAGRKAALAPDGQPFQFGVSGEQSERDWPLMIVSEVAGVLASYRISGNIAQLKWHSPRPFAAAALVTMTTGETLFVKRHHIKLRDIAALAEEHAFIAHLSARDIPVTRVLPDRLGRTAVSTGDWTYEVHLAADGEDIYRDVMSWEPFAQSSHAYAAGLALARLHRASASYDAPARPPRLLVSSFRVIGTADLMTALDAWVGRQPLLEKALAGRPWREDVARVIGPHHARLVPLLPTLQPLWTHGDWHGSNLLWRFPETDERRNGDGRDPGDDSPQGRPAEVCSVLDFGLADRTCAMVDLALAIERNAIEWLVEPAHRTVHLDQIDALLDGYTAIAPLSRADYAALIALLPIVHTEFALSEVGYFAGVLDLPTEAAVAYDGYLLGHVQWFEQPQGLAVLRHLEERRSVLQRPALTH